MAASRGSGLAEEGTTSVIGGRQVGPIVMNRGFLPCIRGQGNLLVSKLF